MDIKIITGNISHINSQLKIALDLLNKRQNYFQYHMLQSYQDNYVFNSRQVDWVEFLNNYYAKFKDGYYVFITDNPFTDNWFSHVSEYVSIITAHSWEEYFSPPALSTYFMYQIIEVSINFEIGISEEIGINKIVHNKTNGCIFDFCMHKEDIKIGMRTGIICPECVFKLREYGMNDEGLQAIENILDCIRAKTLGRSEEQMNYTPKEKIKVLFLAANPKNTKQLRLDQEVRDIVERISKARHRDSIEFVSCWAVRAVDLFQAINEVNPSIIHFSGHGSKDGCIALEDDNGNAKLISPEVMTSVVTISNSVKFVFFDTCDSVRQAESVARYVDGAIGMVKEISDNAARTFSAQFYSAIGFGVSIQEAFKQA